jgi:4-oxalocrotonate tautomerase
MAPESGRHFLLLWTACACSAQMRGEQLEVTIMGETNTRGEKADYHKAAYELLAGLSGNVHPHSSIHVADCRPTAYGYGGVTQAWRYQHG